MRVGGQGWFPIYLQEAGIGSNPNQISPPIQATNFNYEKNMGLPGK